MASDLPNVATSYIDSARTIAQIYGIGLEIGSDFSSFHEASMGDTDKDCVAPIFDQRLSNISSENGIWMKGRDRHGDVVHTQAIRLIDLGDKTLAEHFVRNLGDYRPHGNLIDPDKSRYFLSPQSARIRGQVCYHGECWLLGGKNGYRGSSLSAVLPRVLALVALLKWSPSYIFAITAPIAACRGLTVRSGFTYIDQHSIFWHQSGKSKPMVEWLMWTSAEDVLHNLRVSPEILHGLLDPAAGETNRPAKDRSTTLHKVA